MAAQRTGLQTAPRGPTQTREPQGLVIQRSFSSRVYVSGNKEACLKHPSSLCTLSVASTIRGHTSAPHAPTSDAWTRSSGRPRAPRWCAGNGCPYRANADAGMPPACIVGRKLCAHGRDTHSRHSQPSTASIPSGRAAVAILARATSPLVLVPCSPYTVAHRPFAPCGPSDWRRARTPS
ncbi:hypothetical protein PHLGIDRAFT_286896 [Phlebiopsis gigantea 11061_1 CR5-6]|uniref:Uncharacterized protein n=1 Tax=Phlebiopsis gigantea (strain 11061_1 CR5-6) TaxID=745531 RepID=A0A0C3PC15_PHLG1|nr:hypothetical protein PHLGIDRAFT_286896 [Phlebiopsis gigantea 11061_1 CR5-6]